MQIENKTSELCKCKVVENDQICDMVLMYEKASFVLVDKLLVMWSGHFCLHGEEFGQASWDRRGKQSLHQLCGLEVRAASGLSW